MNARAIGSAVTAVVVLAAAITGCATMRKKTPEDVVAERQQLMKRQGALWKDIQDKTKAGDTVAVASDAGELVDTAKRIPTLFPEGSITPKSNAKPEIWQRKPEFEAAAKKLEAEAQKLRDTANTGNLQATQAVVQTFGRTTCGNCHTPFRVPPKQS